MYRVLSVSRNIHLSLERNNVLTMAGFSVMSPLYPEQASTLAMQERADAVVIGHSVEPSVRESIIQEVRQLCPKCVICFVYAAPDTAGEPLADISLDVTKGPEPLVVVLQEWLPKTIRAA